MGTSKLLGNLTNCRGMTCDGLASRPGGVEIHVLLAASCYKNQGQAPVATCMSQLAPRRHFF